MRGTRIACLIALLAATCRPAAAEGGTPYGPATARVSVCFVPEQACGMAVVEAIDAARRSIRVQAYGFTSAAILRALAAARARGVDVQAILDKSDDRERGNRLTGARFRYYFASGFRRLRRTAAKPARAAANTARDAGSGVSSAASPLKLWPTLVNDPESSANTVNDEFRKP